jgi:hypothetical protein
VSAIELVSPLQPDEGAARLAAAIDQGMWLSWRGSKPVVGRVSGWSIRLAKRIGYQNSFQTILRGRLAPHSRGSVFRGTAGMHPGVAFFMAVWLAVAACVGVAGMVGGAAQLVDAIPALLMMAFGVAVAGLGRWLARNEKPFLVVFLAEVLAADRP